MVFWFWAQDTCQLATLVVDADHLPTPPPPLSPPGNFGSCNFQNLINGILSSPDVLPRSRCCKAVVYTTITSQTVPEILCPTSQFTYIQDSGNKSTVVQAQSLLWLHSPIYIQSQYSGNKTSSSLVPSLVAKSNSHKARILATRAVQAWWLLWLHGLQFTNLGIWEQEHFKLGASFGCIVSSLQI